MSLNRNDSRIILNWVFCISDADSGLEVSGKGYSSLHDSIDSKQMVKTLCSFQKYKNMTEFLSLTCNMKTHFEIKMIKEWINDNEWHRYYPGYHKLNFSDQIEIEKSMSQAACVYFLRN